MISKIIMLLLIASCSSVPKGNPQLGKMIQRDKISNNSRSSQYLHQGRPVFIKATLWPQVLEGGDISQKSNILLMIGREKISVDEVLKKNGEK